MPLSINCVSNELVCVCGGGGLLAPLSSGKGLHVPLVFLPVSKIAAVNHIIKIDCKLRQNRVKVSINKHG